jgi:hypothetical protein
MIRSKQLVGEGDSSIFDGRCIPIWSAPNFCGWAQSAAALVQVVSNVTVPAGSVPAKFMIITRYDARPTSERLSVGTALSEEEDDGDDSDSDSLPP